MTTPSATTVYVLVYSNYSPAEVYSIHRTREGAEKERARFADDMDIRIEVWPLKP
jgi:hypothetical protein